MAETINCPSCGASNQFPEGKTSMFCAFCGGNIFNQNSKHTNNGCLILSKPKISEKKIEYTPGKLSPYLSGLISLKTGKNPIFENVEKRRVHDGFEYFTGDGWSFVKDEEIVVDEGGELSLCNRNVSHFNQISEWFSDNELESIKRLILIDNKIVSFEGIEKFKNLIVLDLTSNFINEESITKNIDTISFIDVIVLKNNPITTIPIELPKNSVINDVLKCSKCNSERTEYMLNQFKELCKKCYDSKVKTENFEKIKESILNDNNMRNAFYEQPTFFESFKSELSNGKCFIATATMGSYDHPEVMELRNFRDNWILEKSWGERFVKWYYHYGQIASKSIEKSIVLKKISYILIVKPLVFISRLLK